MRKDKNMEYGYRTRKAILEADYFYKGFCIDYMTYEDELKQYRIYRPERPHDTVAYCETFDEAIESIDWEESRWQK